VDGTKANIVQLYGILEYRNVEATKLLTLKAQVSADHVEFMTQSMHELAEKTKQEAVSMRIITLVTLFFLPGTFISVRCHPFWYWKYLTLSVDFNEHGYCTMADQGDWSSWAFGKNCVERCYSDILGYHLAFDASDLLCVVLLPQMEQTARAKEKSQAGPGSSKVGGGRSTFLTRIWKAA
jgi:hypothetical protein